MRIEIERDESGCYTVRCGDRWQDRLGFDEALGAVACLLIPAGGIRVPYLKTKEQHDAWEAWLNQVRES